jgi:hypothetical protein
MTVASSSRVNKLTLTVLAVQLHNLLTRASTTTSLSAGH